MPPSGPWKEESKEDSQAVRDDGLLVAQDQASACRLVAAQIRLGSDVHLTCKVGGRVLALAPVCAMNCFCAELCRRIILLRSHAVKLPSNG
jgi:hypothetical protein